MSTNWIDEAIRTQSGLKPFGPSSSGTLEHRDAASPVLSTAARSAPVDNSRRRWLLALTISVQLAIVVSLPIPRAVASWLLWDRFHSHPPTYALRRSGELPLPAGIDELRYVGTTVVATTSPRWQFLSEREQASIIQTLGGWLEPDQDLCVFMPSGRAVGRLHAGIVEVYP